jgi:hypothetical protein
LHQLKLATAPATIVVFSIRCDSALQRHEPGAALNVALGGPTVFRDQWSPIVRTSNSMMTCVDSNVLKENIYKESLWHTPHMHAKLGRQWMRSMSRVLQIIPLHGCFQFATGLSCCTLLLLPCIHCHNFHNLRGKGPRAGSMAPSLHPRLLQGLNNIIQSCVVLGAQRFSCLPPRLHPLEGVVTNCAQCCTVDHSMHCYGGHIDANLSGRIRAKHMYACICYR